MSGSLAAGSGGGAAPRRGERAEPATPEAGEAAWSSSE
jgi:hypothetical protein